MIGAKHVYTIENNPMCRRVIDSFITHNKLTDRITVLEWKAEGASISEFANKVSLLIRDKWLYIRVD